MNVTSVWCWEGKYVYSLLLFAILLNLAYFV